MTNSIQQDSYKQSVEFYETDSNDYDARRWTTPAGRYLNEVQLNVVREMLATKSNQRHLDIATGTGRFAIDAAVAGAQVTALDSSDGMLTECRKRAEHFEVADRVTTQQGWANKMEYVSEFDSCTCINALNHIPDQQGVLDSAAKAIEDGGILISNYTNWLSFYLPIGVYVNLRKKSIHGDVYTKWFSLWEIKNLHKKCGLEIIEIQGVLHIPTRVKNKVLLKFLMGLDRLCRKTVFRFFAPQVYIRARKTGPSLSAI